jgi:Uma2 family endonuclease
MSVLEQLETSLITGEELALRPDLEPCELIDGRIVPLTPTGHVHGSIEARLTVSLGIYARESGRGQVLSGEVGLYIRRNPDTVRAADLLYISHSRFSRNPGKSYLEVAPELVVEVLSPQDRWSEVMEKLSDYFEAGVDRAWVVDPRTRRVFAYRSLAGVEVFEGEDVLRDEEILPGFALPVAELFPL